MLRDAAVARLRLAGTRALPRLRAFLTSDAPAAARVAALSALDGVDDPRVLEPALSALEAPDPDVVVAGLAVLRGWVAREDGTRVLDAVARIALDRGRDGRARVAALDALSDLPRNLVQPILDQAPAPDPRAAADDPGTLREWIGLHGTHSPLSVLHDLVVRAREQERAQAPPHVRQQWQSVRAALHGVLAARGSRVALYDLRETFDGAEGPLPLEFLAAVSAIGDASCLEPMARAWSASSRDPWWRDRVADAAAAIVQRLRLGGRNAVVKRIRAKWTGFL